MHRNRPEARGASFWEHPAAVTALGALLLLFFFYINWLSHTPDRIRTALLDLFPVLPQVTALVLGIALYRESQSHVRMAGLGWLLIGIGCFLNVPAAFSWAWYDGVLVREPPVPSLADGFYLASYPVQIAGVLCLFRASSIAHRTRILLDCTIVTSAVAVSVWLLVGNGLWHQSSLSAAGMAVTLAQPLFDVGVLFAVLLLATSDSPFRGEQAGRLALALGMAFWSLGDLLYTRDTLVNAYYTGIWYEGSWTVGAAAMALGLWCAWRSARQGQAVAARADEDAPLRAIRLLMPSGFLMAAAGSIILEQFNHLPGSFSQRLTAISIPVALAVVRQLMLLFEEGATTARLRARGERLEAAVAQRRQEMDALHELIGEVNGSLEENAVWAVALRRTRQALDAPEAAIWLPLDPAGAPRSLAADELSHRPLILTQAHRDAADATQAMAWLFDRIDYAPDLTLLSVERIDEAAGDARARTACCLHAPIVWRERYYGSIGLFYPGNVPPEEERRLLVDIGRAVAPAIANARSYAEAREAADRDPVTGLLNHRAIHQRLRTHLQQAAEDEKPLSLLMIDVDNFKLFNDTHGHLAGDSILRKVAHHLTQSCPAHAAIGRYGGDEFCVALPGIGADLAEALGARLNQCLREENIAVENSGESYPLTLSVGVALFPRDGLHRHELMAHADRNMYRAKRHSAPRRSAPAQGTERYAADLQQAESLAALEAMVAAIDNKDQYTRAHSEDVTEFASWIAQELGVGGDTLRQLRLAGLLHDIGKIGVPDEILRKPGTLTPDEFEAMKRHAAIGALIVGAMPGLSEIVPAIRGHHERWDGNGYPDRLAGEAIPLLARILAIADAFSAMTTDRPYRKAMPWQAALGHIAQNVGGQFDPELARLFVRIAPPRLEDFILPAPEWSLPQAA